MTTIKRIEMTEEGRAFIQSLEKKHEVTLLTPEATSEEILFQALQLESKSVEKICRNVSREVGNIVSWEDIQQSLWVTFLSKPYSMDKFEFFYRNIKRVAKDATKTAVRRYAAFSKIYIKQNFKLLNGFSLHKGAFGAVGDFHSEEFNALTNEFQPSTETVDYNRLERADFMENWKDGLSDSEKTVFMGLLKGYTKREIDEELGSRCDRIIKRVREMYKEYMGMDSDSKPMKQVEYASIVKTVKARKVKRVMVRSSVRVAVKDIREVVKVPDMVEIIKPELGARSMYAPFAGMGFNLSLNNLK
ncbi:hypothetical protein [Paenibacillus sp. MMO-177]|uniref:hypothetical protein n=1 Tax=Paenibacillus sp. MMO-177 TaxID=3081289 RepID=UPI0030186151